MKTRLHILLWAWLLTSPFGLAVPARAEGTPATIASQDKKTIPYKLGRQDKISISVVGQLDLNVARTTVDANGDVNLSLVHEVHIGGLTVTEAQAAIENAYKDGRYLRNPQVTVTIEDYAPRTVVVGGLVKYPGTINLPPETPMTLRELISKAGLAETANAKEIRISRLGPDGKPMVIKKNVDGIMTGKNNANAADANFIIEPDDTVYVPEKMF